MYFSIFPQKDTTIYDVTIRGVKHTASSAGQSEILELFHLTESNSNFGDSRILLYFDLTDLSQSIINGNIPSSSVQYKLKLKNANHIETVPYSYNINVYALSTSFAEGRTLSNYDEGLKDDGVANWIKATSIKNWDNEGGDFITSSFLTASQYFDFGTEDLELDISNIVYAWLTGSLENNGLLLKYDDFFATGSIDYYNKKFFSRHSLVEERKPKIQVFWENVLQDDRSELSYEYTSSLVYYRYIGGMPNNINEPIYVDILNSSSMVVQTLTASNVDNGIYAISGVYISPTPNTQIYRDIWFTSTKQLFTGTFTPVYSTGSSLLNFDSISMSIPNLKPSYYDDENVVIRVFAKCKDYKPAVVKIGSLTPNPILLKNAYFQIENAETEEVIIPFSTGSLSNKFSKLSYDFEGNYFKLMTSAFSKNNIYKIKILVDYNNKRFIFNKTDWKFKIE